MFVCCVVCCQVEVCATGWSFAQRTLTDCGCVHESSIMRRPWPTGGLLGYDKKRDTATYLFYSSVTPFSLRHQFIHKKKGPTRDTWPPPGRLIFRRPFKPMFFKSYCSTVHIRRITSIYQPTIAHIISHFKKLRHVSILSDHNQGALFHAKFILEYSQFNSYL